MSTSLSDYDALKFGALLHDVGKFLEQAGRKREPTSSYDKPYLKYAHPQIGGVFLESINIDPLIVDLVYYHHDTDLLKSDKNKAYLCKIIQLSDYLSSGEKSISEEDIEILREYQQLVSVFNRVRIKNANSHYEPLYEDLYKYKIDKLDFSKKDIIFPKKDACGFYEGFLKSFEDEIKQEIKNFTNLFFLLQKYWWCVPSAAYSEKVETFPDVSLFDHSKATCAIAACLYKQQITEEELDKLIKEDENILNEPKFCLIRGDISGIQKFIYTITTKSAAKSLKGRSLFLVLLQRFVAEHILEKLDLPLTNLIYSGGGHFNILAPKKLCELSLDEIKKEINEKLFKIFKTEIYLVLSSVDVCAKDLIGKNFANKWGEVVKNISEQKMKKYWEFKYDEIFEPFDEGGEKEICDICGAELGNDAKKDRWDKFCDMCKEFINVSDYLKEIQNNEYFVISEIKNKLKILNGFKTILDGKIYLNPSKGVPFFSIPVGIPIVVDKNENKMHIRIKDFTEIAKDAEETTGTNKIGILRMDIDNLGKIFESGLGDNATLSRVSTLSRFFSFFFEGYLNEFIKEKYKDDIYLIYSGGDDTFVVGRWDKLIDFTYEVYKEFRNYTCCNPDITLSAGIVIVDPKYPIKRSAAKAGDELEKAKEVKENGHEKNSICIFGLPIKWDIDGSKGVNEFKIMKEIEEDIVKCINQGAQRELIQRIKISAKKLKEILCSKGKSNGIDISAYWRLQYYLARNYKDEKENWKYEELNTLIENVYNKIINAHLFKQDAKYNIDVITVAARIAELKTREKHQLNDNLLNKNKNIK